MSKTKLWSLQFSCRRLAREARGLAALDGKGGAKAAEIEQHLDAAARLLTETMDAFGEITEATGSAVLDLAQLALGDGSWTRGAPQVDTRLPHESAPSADHTLAMHVKSGFLATPDLLAFLCSLRKSGVLFVETADERFTIELVDGDIAHAHSDGAPDAERLGNVLVEHGVLTHAVLDRLLGESSRLRLGARVLERQLAGRDDLRTALETQIRRLFQRLFTARAHNFVFWEGPCVWGDLSMRLNATMLLLDGARAADEEQRGAGGRSEAMAAALAGFRPQPAAKPAPAAGREDAAGAPAAGPDAAPPGEPAAGDGPDGDRPDRPAGNESSGQDA